jgi:squalene synthase HpnC
VHELVRMDSTGHMQGIHPDGGSGQTMPVRLGSTTRMASFPASLRTQAPEGTQNGVGAVPLGIPDAQAVMQKAGLENFRVASRALPAALRGDLHALYGFARLVDDLGDEARGDRDAMLDWLEGDLEALYAGRPMHELMRRLQPTVVAHSIPPEPFERLIAANRQDQQVSRYETFEDLVAYCRLSADPVGHLVLYVFDSATPERMLLADRVCTGLQVVEHLQDVGEDLARGRVYLPQEDLRRFECTDADLGRRPASDAVRALVAYQAARARRLLLEGAPLARSLPWRARLAVTGFVSGGLAALGAIERSGFDVLGEPPRASRVRRAGALLSTVARLARS